MKKKCYPKYSYMLYLFLSIICIVLSILPLFIKTNEEYIYIILWGGSMILFAFLFFIGFLFNMQYYRIIDNKIVIYNTFGKINEIDLCNAVYEVAELNTYFSWVISISKKWICIYKKRRFYDKFKSGCSNKKNKEGIQIIYSDDLMLELRNRNVEQLSLFDFKL